MLTVGTFWPTIDPRNPENLAEPCGNASNCRSCLSKKWRSAGKAEDRLAYTERRPRSVHYQRRNKGDAGPIRKSIGRTQQTGSSGDWRGGLIRSMGVRRLDAGPAKPSVQKNHRECFGCLSYRPFWDKKSFIKSQNKARTVL